MKRVRKIAKWAGLITVAGFVVQLVGGAEIKRKQMEMAYRQILVELHLEQTKSRDFKAMFVSLAEHAGDEAVKAWEAAADSDVQFLEIKEATEAEGDANGEAAPSSEEA